MILKARHLIRLFVTTLAFSAAVAGQAREIYVVDRNDTRGSGTQKDPYDVGTAARFDAILAEYPSGTDFHFGAGTYYTYGYYYQHENIHAGCRLFGAGIAKTIIRLVAPGNGKKASEVMFGTDYNRTADGFQMHDLTLDCNAAANPIFRAGLGAVGAMNIQGNNILIQDVKIVGFGTSKQGDECFVFFSYPGSFWKGKTFQNIKLDHVTFTAPAKGNRDGCSCTTLTAAQGVNVENTEIVNCQFLDLDSGGFTYSHALGALTNENNFVRNMSEGIYFETADDQNRTFVYKNNTFLNVRKGVYVNWHPGAYIGKIIFDDNKVTLRPDIMNNAAIGMNDAGIPNGKPSSRIGYIEFENNAVSLASFGEFSSTCRAVDLRSPGHHSTIGEFVASGNKISLPTGVPYNIQSDIVGKVIIH